MNHDEAKELFKELFKDEVSRKIVFEAACKAFRKAFDDHPYLKREEMTDDEINLKNHALEIYELLKDLLEVLPTSLSNSHIDLIQRTKELIKKIEGNL